MVEVKLVSSSSDDHVRNRNIRCLGLVVLVVLLHLVVLPASLSFVVHAAAFGVVSVPYRNNHQGATPSESNNRCCSKTRLQNDKDDKHNKYDTHETATTTTTTTPETNPATAAAATAGIRLNKILCQTHSRRQADQLIAQGRVAVNGCVVSVSDLGRRVSAGDIVTCDGTVVPDWWSQSQSQPQSQSTSPATTTTTSATTDQQQHEYIKYFKPAGVTCTTDRRIPGNIIDAILASTSSSSSSSNSSTSANSVISRRIFPVGRLDKDTTGLILLTSDGRLPQACLRHDNKVPKTYRVHLDKPVSQAHIRALQQGVMITTQVVKLPTTTATSSSTFQTKQRKTFTAPTLPAIVQQYPNNNNKSKSSNVLEITIVEGRNRQVRKMMEALGYRVLRLHRTAFMGITLRDLKGPGDWKRLQEKDDDDDDDDDDDEMQRIYQQLELATTTSTGTSPGASASASTTAQQNDFSKERNNNNN